MSDLMAAVLLFAAWCGVLYLVYVWMQSFDD